jgi:hypothetical protein
MDDCIMDGILSISMLQLMDGQKPRSVENLGTRNFMRLSHYVCNRANDPVGSLALALSEIRDGIMHQLFQLDINAFSRDKEALMHNVLANSHGTVTKFVESVATFISMIHSPVFTSLNFSLPLMNSSAYDGSKKTTASIADPTDGKKNFFLRYANNLMRKYIGVQGNVDIRILVDILSIITYIRAICIIRSDDTESDILDQKRRPLDKLILLASIINSVLGRQDFRSVPFAGMAIKMKTMTHTIGAIPTGDYKTYPIGLYDLIMFGISESIFRATSTQEMKDKTETSLSKGTKSPIHARMFALYPIVPALCMAASKYFCGLRYNPQSTQTFTEVDNGTSVTISVKTTESQTPVGPPQQAQQQVAIESIFEALYPNVQDTGMSKVTYKMYVTKCAHVDIIFRFMASMARDKHHLLYKFRRSKYVTDLLVTVKAAGGADENDDDTGREFRVKQEQMEPARGAGGQAGGGVGGGTAAKGGRGGGTAAGGASVARRSASSVVPATSPISASGPVPASGRSGR